MRDAASVLRRLGTILVAPPAFVSALSTSYLLTLLAGSTRDAGQQTPDPAADPSPFVVAVLVPAHDEAAGIDKTLEALTVQDHPRAQREVFVVADNCTDATAAVAEQHDVVVWSRDDPDRRGKGYALTWGLSRLWEERPDVDAVLVVDADCIASENLVSAVARAMQSGAVAVQAAYRVANAEASRESALRAAGFALMHDVRAGGKSALGLSAGLFGTGMAFRSSVLRAIPWSGSAVTEDTDYHLRLVRAGIVVRYVSEASVSSDMPTTAADARSQHMRWEGGNATLARRTVPGLLAEGLRLRDVQVLHAGVERLVPAQSLLAATSGVAVAGAAVLGARGLRNVALLGAFGQVAYVLVGLRVAGVPAATWRALVSAPALVARRLALAAGIARHGGPTEWTRTEREAS